MYFLPFLCNFKNKYKKVIFLFGNTLTTPVYLVY